MVSSGSESDSGEPHKALWEYKRSFLQRVPKHIKDFDPLSLVDSPDEKGKPELDKFIAFVGKRRTGKSVTMRSLLDEMIGDYGAKLYRMFDRAAVVTKTKFNQYWQQHFPSDFIHNDIEHISLLLQEQAEFIDWWYKHPEVQVAGPHYVNPYLLLVIDDVASAENARHIEMITELATMGRHLKCMVMISTQYVKLLNTTVRENVDLLFIYYQNTLMAKDALCREFFSMIEPYEAAKMIDDITEVKKGKPRQVLVWNNMVATSNLSKRLFIYTPNKKPKPFLVGTREMWAQNPSDAAKYLDWLFKQRAKQFKSFVAIKESEQKKQLKDQ